MMLPVIKGNEIEPGDIIRLDGLDIRVETRTIMPNETVTMRCTDIEGNARYKYAGTDEQVYLVHRPSFVCVECEVEQNHKKPCLCCGWGLEE